MMKLLLTFVIFNVLNVIVQTIRSIATVKCGKTIASLVNAIAYGLYTYIVILTMCDLPLLTKALVVAVCNLVGVYVVKLIEEKMRKDKLWLVKITIPHNNATLAKELLKTTEIPFTYYDVGKYVVFDTYCETQKQTASVEGICKDLDGKAFATENKLAL